MAEDEGKGSTEAPAPELTPPQLQFHLEEYRGLRAEITATIRSQFEAYLYALVANGGIIAWLLANRAQLDTYGYWGLKLAALVPFLVTLLAYCWTLFYGKHIQTAGGYLRKLEERIGAANLGWETFLASQPHIAGSHLLKRMYYGNLLWILLFLADIAFALAL